MQAEVNAIMVQLSRLDYLERKFRFDIDLWNEKDRSIRVKNYSCEMSCIWITWIEEAVSLGREEPS